MDVFEMIRAGMVNAVPFARLAGIEILSISSGRAEARLVQRDEVSNHIGTVHAGALFTLGETASGAAMSGLFADRLAQLRPVATEAAIDYLRPGRGTVHATATCEGDSAQLVQTLDRDGKVRFQINVSVRDADGTDVAAMRVGWQVRRR